MRRGAKEEPKPVDLGPHRNPKTAYCRYCVADEAARVAKKKKAKRV